ncbi:MAG: very short patch repair endonuclease [Roseococcus sp.]
MVEPDEGPPPSAARSATMARVRSSDTAPEIVVRRALHAAGLRFRLGGHGLPGRPDIVLPGRRAVVFVHGCWWHGHACPRGARIPATRTAYWKAKVDRNRARDASAAAALREAGWTVEVVWECALRGKDRIRTLTGLVERLHALAHQGRLVRAAPPLTPRAARAGRWRASPRPAHPAPRPPARPGRAG